MKEKTTKELIKEYHEIISALQRRHTTYNATINDYEINGEEDFKTWIKQH